MIQYRNQNIQLILILSSYYNILGDIRQLQITVLKLKHRNVLKMVKCILRIQRREFSHCLLFYFHVMNKPKIFEVLVWKILLKTSSTNFTVTTFLFSKSS